MAPLSCLLVGGRVFPKRGHMFDHIGKLVALVGLLASCLLGSVDPQGAALSASSERINASNSPETTVLRLWLKTQDDYKKPQVTRSEQIAKTRSSAGRLQIPGGGHGSYMAYARHGEWTYLLTAKHVVNDNWNGWESHVWYTTNWSEGEKDHQELAQVVLQSRQYDLAVLRVKNSVQPISPLASIGTLRYDQEILAIGYPKDSFPSVCSYGFLKHQELITELGQNRILQVYTAGTNRGNSGGAIVDFNTLEIVAVVVQFGKITDPWRGDLCNAEPLSSIYSFLMEVHKEEIK